MRRATYSRLPAALALAILVGAWHPVPAWPGTVQAGRRAMPAPAPGGITLAGPVQNDAYAKLDIVSGTAQARAWYKYAQDPNVPVSIAWSLLGWNRGWTEKDTLQAGTVSGTGEVELSVDLSVPWYDYYLLECTNEAANDSLGETSRFLTESRYGHVAPYDGIWERTGEVTSDRAVLHTYLTEKGAPDATGEAPHRVPPMAGYAQFVVYGDPDLRHTVAASRFFPIDDYVRSGGQWLRANYNVRWQVTGLEPDHTYYYKVRTLSSDRRKHRIGSNVNSFRTAPVGDADAAVAFAVVGNLDPYNTCYDPPELGETLGLKVFASMLAYDPDPLDFLIMTGDTVYYDAPPWAPLVGYGNKEYLRRWHFWYAQYRFVNLREFFRQVPAYWLVDDHDYWANNATEIYPDGWHIFRNVNPTPGRSGTEGEGAEAYYDENPYGTSSGSGTDFWRAIRWGRHLELFLEEGRNHRDQDAGLIWGDEQRQWLEDRILESDATFKVVVASTPLLGPAGTQGLPDKHCQLPYRLETESFLMAIKDVPNVFLIAGDRHWKYHSVVNAANYPQLAHFNEFSPGAAAGGNHVGAPGLLADDWAQALFADGAYGTGASAGYLRVEVVPGAGQAQLRFELIAVTEDLDNSLLYTATFTSSPERR